MKCPHCPVRLSTRWALEEHLATHDAPTYRLCWIDDAEREHHADSAEVAELLARCLKLQAAGRQAGVTTIRA